MKLLYLLCFHWIYFFVAINHSTIIWNQTINHSMFLDLYAGCNCLLFCNEVKLIFTICLPLAEWSWSKIVSYVFNSHPEGPVVSTGMWSEWLKTLPVHKVWWTPLVDGKMVLHITRSGWVYSHPILRESVVSWITGPCPVCSMHII